MTSELDAFRELLPTWVNVGAWCAMPLLMAAVAAVMMWGAARLLRPKFDGLHWTEVARLHFAYMRLLGLNALSRQGGSRSARSRIGLALA